MTDHLSRPPSLRLGNLEQRVILFLGDLLASIIALVASLYIWIEYSWRALLATGIALKKAESIFSLDVQFWIYFLPFVWLLLLIELYEPQVAANRKKTQRGIMIAGIIAFVGYALIFMIIKDPTSSLPRIVIGAFLLIAALLTWLWRLLYIRLYTSQGLTRRILIVGAGKAGATLAKAYEELEPKPFLLVGFSDDDPDKIGSKFEGFRVLGSNRDLIKLIEQHNINDIVVAITGSMMGSTFQTILDVQEAGVMVTRMPTIFEEITGRVPIHHLESDWLIRSFVDETRVSAFYELGKRVVDLLGSVVGIMIFLVTMPLISLAIIIETGFPVFYGQDRLGQGGKPFMLYKFRTMRQDAEADGVARLAQENDPRVTRVGNFLRKTRLDEFPQFFNVLRGEMSLVGPRAEREELVKEFQEQIPFYRARLLVKPGISGWAQITSGYASSIFGTSLKLEYDLYYIKHRTVAMDITILLRTFSTVFGFKGR
ncbi:MAG: sugar transferase [Anaerolineae bacterium]|jgi:exopolysaccharide biosynthesis polyprenyl glycosylphosphotransferase|nr:sugar transferase [Anaerolineae bacterium]MBT7071767.1 sugar transferase [Anaerolineae bacterium]MBT7324475.1 sugar transferase [Anaerolineae bacterium]